MTTALTQTYTAPEPFFNLANGRELKMTFGMLNRLARIAGNVETLGMVMIDSDLQQALLSQLFATYDEKGKQLEVADIDNINCSMEELLQLLAWVLESLTYFFLKNLQNSAKIAQQYKPEEKAQ
jgi:hypothetical protein